MHHQNNIISGNHLKTGLKKDFDKKEFTTGASGSRMICWYLINLLFFRSGLVPFSNILVLILRIFGAKIGKQVRIKPHIYVKYPWKLSIGDYSWLADCYLDNLAQITIGNHVCISQKAMLITGNHDYKSTHFDLITKPITIEDGAWICANATVTPGVTIKTHAILTTGSVATQDIEAYTIYQGNPAAPVRGRQIRAQKS